MISDIESMMQISIHALREEGDPSSDAACRAWVNFYPRPPRGGRQSDKLRAMLAKEFLSTPSARRATAKTEKASPLLIKV
mgnify:CR=1 FL=1